MFAEPTVFLVGAGASKEFKLPTGDELRGKIQERLRFVTPQGGGPRGGDGTIYDLLLEDRPKHRELLAAAQLIATSLPLVDSIDDFVDTHAQDEAVTYCAKLAIVRTISTAERRSLLYFSEAKGQTTIAWHDVQNTWLTRLFRLMRVDTNKHDPAKLFQNVSFVSFNYDRSLEHFLHNALRSLFRLKADEAATVLANVPIFHPYGTIGRLPWMAPDRTPVPYGEEIGAFEAKLAAGGLRTYSEAIETERMQDLHRLIAEARVVVSLGCAYHRQNMRLLTVEKSRISSFFGTALGVSDRDRDIISDSRIAAMCGQRPRGQTRDKPELANLTCNDFIQQYGNAIMRN